MIFGDRGSEKSWEILSGLDETFLQENSQIKQVATNKR
jgi:hypothetical protein